MPTSKQWYTSANLALADSSTAAKCAHSSLWALGAMLTGNQSGTDGPEGARPGSCDWTLDGSSDSTTAGIDTTDRLHFAGSFTDADWVRNTAGNAHTWYVLKSPNTILNGPWYLCVDYASGNDQTCSLIIANNAFTGGSTANRPTATRESVLSSFQFCSSTAAAGKTHLNVDANGNFRWLRSRNATGYFDTYISVESLVEYHSSDPARAFLTAHFVDSGRGVLHASPTGLSIRGLSTDGITALSAGNVANMGEMRFYPASVALSSYTTTNAIDGTVDALPCIYMYDDTTSHKGIRGRYPDMWDVGEQVAVGSTFPSTGDTERVLVGSRMIAMSVAPNL